MALSLMSGMFVNITTVQVDPNSFAKIIIDCSLCGTGGDERDRRTVFVKNVPFSATKDCIGELFESVTDVRLPLNEEGQPKG
jgi:hypothetical protein